MKRRIHELDFIEIKNLEKILTKTTNLKMNNPVKKWVKDLNGHHTKEDMQMAPEHNESCNTSLENFKLKPQWDITTHLVEWPKSKTLTPPNADQDVEHLEPSLIAGGDAERSVHFGRQLSSFLQN